MERALPDPRRWWTLAVLCLSLAIIGLDNTILNVAIPTIQREFAATGSELQWMIDAYILVFAGLLLTMGALGDRFGRAKALQAGLAIFGISSLGAAFAQTSEQLIAGRAIMGIGGALIMPATLSIIINVFPREERGRAIAIWTGVSGAAIGLGPLMGGLLIEWFWWGSVLLINVPIVIVAMIAGVWLVPESRDDHPDPLDIPGAALSMAAVSVLLFGIIEAPTHGWTDPLVISAFVASVVLAVAFLWRERTTPTPMLDLSLFRNMRFSAGSGSISLAFFALMGSVFALTQYLQFVHNYTALEAGVRMIPVALGIMIGAGRSHLMVGRFGSRAVIAAALAGLAAIFASMVLWEVDTSYWVIGFTLFFAALFMGNTVAPATEAVMSAVPEARAGIGSAVNDITRQVGGAIGIAVMGSILNTVFGNRMADVTAQLPQEAAEPARDSIGPALQVASMLGGEPGAMLASAARVAFVDGLAFAVGIAAAVAIVASLLVLRFMPEDERSPHQATARPAASHAPTS